MKWHKISDGDYPEVGRYVLVAPTFEGQPYNEKFCLVSQMKIIEDGKRRWLENWNYWSIRPTDRWTYIDLPTD